jgi:glucosamine-6-phosphate deaminase
MTAEFKVDNLDVRIYEARQDMGGEAAALACDKIKELLAQKDFVNMIFAAAPSQIEFLEALIDRKDIPWQRVNGFHMDEYIGLPGNAPQSFGTFLRDRLFSKLPFNSISYINGNTTDPKVECHRYTDLLQKFPPDIVCMGIGENGHIAFNDPHVADFNDPQAVKIVDLDQECRQQQVNDGCFAALKNVPTHAITLTIPALIASKFIYCMVPGKNKANAVESTLNGTINEQCPASILRKHAGALLFLDRDSSSSLKHYI